ncbi:MAG: hypothetical protein HS111_23395 [Kofleriaceae bacterium]|nr:hypothetical protein [Kofleriaceae bacterium]
MIEPELRARRSRPRRRATDPPLSLADRTRIEPKRGLTQRIAWGRRIAATHDAGLAAMAAGGSARRRAWPGVAAAADDRASARARGSTRSPRRSTSSAVVARRRRLPAGDADGAVRALVDSGNRGSPTARPAPPAQPRSGAPDLGRAVAPTERAGGSDLGERTPRRARHAARGDGGGARTAGPPFTRLGHGRRAIGARRWRAAAPRRPRREARGQRARLRRSARAERRAPNARADASARQPAVGSSRTRRRCRRPPRGTLDGARAILVGERATRVPRARAEPMLSITRTSNAPLGALPACPRRAWPARAADRRRARAVALAPSADLDQRDRAPAGAARGARGAAFPLAFRAADRPRAAGRVRGARIDDQEQRLQRALTPIAS